MSPQSYSIPASFVPLNYLNDPETEDLIFGDQLVEGMVVVIEDALVCRDDPDSYETSGPHRQRRILATARWCRITSVRRDRNIISFIGEYGDGSKMRRVYDISYAWFVKKVSMPD